MGFVHSQKPDINLSLIFGRNDRLTADCKTLRLERSQNFFAGSTCQLITFYGSLAPLSTAFRPTYLPPQAEAKRRQVEPVPKTAVQWTVRRRYGSGGSPITLDGTGRSTVGR
jgi:hypothetical protein